MCTCDILELSQQFLCLYRQTNTCGGVCQCLQVHHIACRFRLICKVYLALLFCVRGRYKYVCVCRSCLCNNMRRLYSSDVGTPHLMYSDILHKEIHNDILIHASRKYLSINSICLHLHF